MDSAPRPRFDIVIVGGGAGGVELAARLGRRLGRSAKASVLLVDHEPLHIWKPTLHEVAAGTIDLHQEGLSYLSLARRNHFSFSLGALAGVDGTAQQIALAPLLDEAGEVILPERHVGYRWLVLATGSGSNFFNTPGAEHAFALEGAADAERFRKALLIGFTQAAFATDKKLRVVVVGGGATGVELCAELHEAHGEVSATLGSAFDLELELTLVEAADRILGALPAQVAERAADALRAMGVRILTGAKVMEIRADALVTTGGDVAAQLIVWAAGIKAPDANQALGLAVNRSNQFVVDDRLQTSAPQVFALGDCAACPWQDGKQVPARAQAAHQQASYLADRLVALVEGVVKDTRFAYRDFGSLVSLGETRRCRQPVRRLRRQRSFCQRPAGPLDVHVAAPEPPSRTARHRRHRGAGVGTAAAAANRRAREVALKR